MTNRERDFATLGLHHAEGIDLADRIELPATGREVRRNKDGVRWDAQPHNDNTWATFDDLLDAVRYATPPTTPELTR